MCSLHFLCNCREGLRMQCCSQQLYSENSKGQCTILWRSELFTFLRTAQLHSFGMEGSSKNKFTDVSIGNAGLDVWSQFFLSAPPGKPTWKRSCKNSFCFFKWYGLFVGTFVDFILWTFSIWRISWLLFSKRLPHSWHWWLRSACIGAER